MQISMLYRYVIIYVSSINILLRICFIIGTYVLFSSILFSKVAKDVSIRLHSQLDSVEKKRTRLEKENEELRVRLQDLEVAKQVLQQEIDKVRPECVEPEEPAAARADGCVQLNEISAAVLLVHVSTVRPTIWLRYGSLERLV